MKIGCFERVDLTGAPIQSAGGSSIFKVPNVRCIPYPPDSFFRKNILLRLFLLFNFKICAMRTIGNFAVVSILLFPFFTGCSSDDFEENKNQDPRSKAVDTLIQGEASAGDLSYQLDQGVIYSYPKMMGGMTDIVIELYSEDYDPVSGVGYKMSFKFTTASGFKLERGTYGLGPGNTHVFYAGNLHTPAWDYTLREGKLVIEKFEDQYHLSWEFTGYRASYLIEETRNVYLKGSYEGILYEVEVW